MESSVKYLLALSIFYNYSEIYLPQVLSSFKDAASDSA